MKLTMRPYQNEADYWRIRNTLREIFLLNNQFERDSHVALLDHWRWHYILTCHETAPVDQVTTLWETMDGQIAAVLHPICHDEIRLHIHPRFHSLDLEEDIVAYAEEHHSDWYDGGRRILYIPVFADDALRQSILSKRGYEKYPARDFHWWRNLNGPLPDAPIPAGYEIRSMGSDDELPARSWASWQAFHAGEPDENYDGDYSWYRNIQSSPLYRRDLDIVAATTKREIVAFCTIAYDDYTRSAVIVLDGVAAEYRQQGLEQAMIVEGMRRLKNLGCTRIFSIAADESTNAIYRQVMQDYLVAHPWIKIWVPD